MRPYMRDLSLDFTDDDYSFMMEYWLDKCAVCGVADDFTAGDHWIPAKPRSVFLVRCNPGKVPENTIPLCRSCNSSKNNHDPIAWLTRKFGKNKAKEIEARIYTYFALTRRMRGLSQQLYPVRYKYNEITVYLGLFNSSKDAAMAFNEVRQSLGDIARLE